MVLAYRTVVVFVRKIKMNSEFWVLLFIQSHNENDDFTRGA